METCPRVLGTWRGWGARVLRRRSLTPRALWWTCRTAGLMTGPPSPIILDYTRAGTSPGPAAWFITGWRAHPTLAARSRVATATAISTLILPAGTITEPVFP